MTPGDVPRVIIVDDDALVRAAIQGMLKSVGHDGKHPELRDKALIPDVLLQAHSASLEMTFYKGTQFTPQYQGEHFRIGTWFGESIGVRRR